MATSRLGKISRFMLIGAGATVAVGGTVLLVSYNEATRIDRSVPKVVVREYVDAALSLRDEDRELLYTCANPRLDAFAALREQLKVEEQAAGVNTQVVVVSALENDDGTKVDTRIQLNQGRGVQVDRRTQHWIFGLKDEDGWRVCSAEQLPDPTPGTSPSATPPTAS